MVHNPEIHTIGSDIEPSAGFRSLMKGVLTHPFKARNGDLVAMGVPVSVETGGICFDLMHPLPEILSLRNGVLSAARDKEIRPSQHSRIMKGLRILRQDIHAMGPAAMASEKLIEILSADHRRLGLHAWIFEDFCVATPWSHEEEIAVLVHRIPETQHLAIAALENHVLSLIQSASVNNTLFRLSRPTPRD